jgi:acyl-CoA dehydrogenase
MSESDLLADAAARLFAQHVDPKGIEAAEQGVWPDKLWQALTDAGMTDPLVPAELGGQGGGWVDAETIVRAAAAAAAPVPLAETIGAGWLLARAGIKPPPGPLSFAGADARRVPWGRKVGHVVHLASAGGRQALALYAAMELSGASDRNIALEPRDDLILDPTKALERRPVDWPADTTRLLGALLRSVQIAGALEASVALGVRYANDRVQFGKPIGKYQAIQHQLAQLAAEAAAAKVAAGAACRSVGADLPRFEIAVAKARASEAAGIGAKIVHQVHGAIGFTYEHRLQFLTRRLWSWRSEFGNAGHWQGELGRMVAARGPEALWSDLTARRFAAAR